MIKSPSLPPSLFRLQEDKVVFDLNLEIQLLLKQGQVELDTDDFMPDFSGSVLVHRSKIEDLNSQIRVSTANCH